MLWHWPIILGSWVHHHEKMCRVHSWSWYDVDLWPQGQICSVYDMALCMSHSFFVLWHSHNHVWACGTMCLVHSWSLNDLELWPICGWRGYSPWVLLTVLYLFQFSTPDISCDALLWFIFFRNKKWKWHLIMSFNFNNFLRSSVKAKVVGHRFDLCISIIAFAPSSPLLKKMEHTVMHLSFDWSVFRQNVDCSMSLIPFACDMPNLVQWLLLESRCSLLMFRSHGQR